MIRTKIENKTTRYHTGRFSTLYRATFYYANTIQKYLILNSKNLVIRCKMIGLSIISIGCAQHLTHKVTPETETETTQTHKKQHDIKQIEVIEVLSIEHAKAYNSNFKNDLCMKDIDSQALKDIVERLESHKVVNLEQINQNEVNNTCAICLDINPIGHFYRITCCNKNVHKECLVHYLLYLKRSSVSIWRSKLKHPVTKLCCEGSRDLWKNLNKGQKKRETERKEAKANKQAVQKIERKLIKAHNLVPYNGPFTCYICMNDFLGNVYLFECAECQNKVCLTCIAKSINHCGNVLLCYFCREYIPLGFIHWQKTLKEYCLPCLPLCLLSGSCASFPFMLLSLLV